MNMARNITSAIDDLRRTLTHLEMELIGANIDYRDMQRIRATVAQATLELNSECQSLEIMSAEAAE